MEEKDNIVDVESEVIEEKKVDNTGNSNQNDQSNTILFFNFKLYRYFMVNPFIGREK